MSLIIHNDYNSCNPIVYEDKSYIWKWVLLRFSMSRGFSSIWSMWSFACGIDMKSKEELFEQGE